jgi:archaellum component FlaF (FlaF/FlaG flagellin family)
MTSIRRITGPLLAVLLACGQAHAADPEFKSSVVTESRTYERSSSSFNVGGIRAGGTTESVSRVTVAHDGLLVTGEWEPKTLQSTTAKDFRRGTDVPAAVSRNRLLLQLPDGSVVTAKIVKRERPKPAELDRRARE